MVRGVVALGNSQLDVQRNLHDYYSCGLDEIQWWANPKMEDGPYSQLLHFRAFWICEIVSSASYR
jgi:hypothetical protein